MAAGLQGIDWRDLPDATKNLLRQQNIEQGNDVP